jgi:hypothetical protein
VPSGRSRNFVILPFVVLLEDEPELKLNAAELEKSIWVPYEEVLRSRDTAELSFGMVPAFVLVDAVVWGITYRILTEFVEAVEQVSLK